MPIAAVNTPAAHAFVALPVDPTGSVVPCSAVQGSGPTAEDALEEATRCLGTAEGLAAFRTGPRLAACLALGDYAPETRFRIERKMSLDEPRAELTCDDEVAEALADVAVALARGRGQWAGRDWDDADRVCPDTADRQIVRLYRTSDRLQVTAWGIDEGANGQDWRSAVRRCVDALGAALDAGDEPGVEEACRALRALACTSDMHVRQMAGEAEESARLALQAARAGDVDEALAQAEEAACLERAFGDAPNWGPLLAAVRRWADLVREAEAA